MKCMIISKQYFMREVILTAVIIPSFLLEGLLKASREVPKRCSGNEFLALWPSENSLQIYTSLLCDDPQMTVWLGSGSRRDLIRC